MAYLQLAEDNNYNMLAQGSVMNNYLTIPPGFMGNDETKYVRIDYFDNLPEEQFALTMAKLAPFQPATLLSARGEGITKIASFASGFIPGVGPLVSKAVEKAGPIAFGLIGKRRDRKKGKAKNEAETAELKKDPIVLPPIDANVSVGGKELNFSLDNTNPVVANTFFRKYKTPLIIGGVLIAVVGGYFALRKKK